MATYIVLSGQVVGNPDSGYRVAYGWDGRRFRKREKAIKHGLRERGSDDFNIGVLEQGRLVQLDWMDEPVDTDPRVLRDIAAEHWPLKGPRLPATTEEQ